MSAQEEAAGVRLVSAEESRRETREWLQETVVAQAEQIAAALALHTGRHMCPTLGGLSEAPYGGGYATCPTARALGVTA